MNQSNCLISYQAPEKSLGVSEEMLMTVVLDNTPAECVTVLAEVHIIQGINLTVANLKNNMNNKCQFISKKRIKKTS